MNLIQKSHKKFIGILLLSIISMFRVTAYANFETDTEKNELTVLEKSIIGEWKYQIRSVSGGLGTNFTPYGNILINQTGTFTFYENKTFTLVEDLNDLIVETGTFEEFIGSTVQLHFKNISKYAKESYLEFYGPNAKNETAENRNVVFWQTIQRDDHGNISSEGSEGRSLTMIKNKAK
jgi:hypothetical protein